MTKLSGGVAGDSFSLVPICALHCRKKSTNEDGLVGLLLLSLQVDMAQRLRKGQEEGRCGFVGAKDRTTRPRDAAVLG